MKELTPSGWIGVLIGIVVFGSLVGHVAAQSKKCWKKEPSTSGLENAEDIIKAFDRTTWIPTCGAGESCLQYIPKNLNAGRVKTYMQCGTACGLPAAVKTAMTPILGAKTDDEYECSACDTEGNTGCKTLLEATKGANQDATKKCYSIAAPLAALSATPKSAPQIFCLDSCQHVTRGDGKVFVGCASDCDKNKEAGAACKTCANQDCEKLIFKQPMCFRTKTDQKLDTVKLITEAYSTSNWKEPCEYNQVCLQYYPDAAGASTGKVTLFVECGAPSGCASKTGYKCHPCDSRDSDSCKKLTDVTGAAKACFDFDSEKETGDSNLIAGFYCFDNCQYTVTGTKVKVGCAKDVKGTDCPATTDPSCAKMIFKPNDPIHTATPSGGAATPSGGATTPSGGTTRPKTSNKLTISKYLLGSLATLLFATNQYMRQF